MKQASLPAALRYDDSLLATLTVMDGEQAYTVGSCPPDLFGHLARESARSLASSGWVLQHLRGYRYGSLADKCHAIRFLYAQGAALPWLPRLMEGS